MLQVLTNFTGCAVATAILVTLSGCAPPPPAPEEPVSATATAGSTAIPAARSLPPLRDWPPRLGQPYPDHEFHDAAGNAVRLSRFRGKVLLVEPIGMNCPACNAFAGGGRPGQSGFRGTRPQPGLKSLEEILPLYAGGVTADHRDLVVVHLLLYSMRMQATTAADADGWARHFGVDRPNHLVLYADERFINPASYDMIPGFQLIDRDFVLRADSTGHQPRDDLYRTLLPMLGRMLGS